MVFTYRLRRTRRQPETKIIPFLQKKILREDAILGYLPHTCLNFHNLMKNSLTHEKPWGSVRFSCAYYHKDIPEDLYGRITLSFYCGKDVRVHHFDIPKTGRLYAMKTLGNSIEDVFWDIKREFPSSATA